MTTRKPICRAASGVRTAAPSSAEGSTSTNSATPAWPKPAWPCPFRRVGRPFIEAELDEVNNVRLGRTKNRSVVGVMNDFSRLAGGARRQDISDLDELSVRLAHTPCGPLDKTHVFPDRALAALVTANRSL